MLGEGFGGGFEGGFRDFGDGGGGGDGDIGDEFGVFGDNGRLGVFGGVRWLGSLIWIVVLERQDVQRWSSVGIFGVRELV